MNRFAIALALLACSAVAQEAAPEAVAVAEQPISEIVADGVILDMTTRVDQGGLVKRGASYSYPQEAYERGVEGVVDLRILVDERGAIAERGDERCPHASLSKAERREATRRWHPKLCIEVVDGSELLGWPATLDAAKTQFRSLVTNGRPEPYFVAYELGFAIE